MAPRILLVEDDPVTRAFLDAAVQALPADVDSADCIASALDLAHAHNHDLWLFDANLPDGDGAQLLATLRAEGLRTPALAHTAARDRAVHDALVDAGFVATLIKPITTGALHGALHDALSRRRLRVADADDGAQPGEPIQAWDDVAALRALNGQREHVDALRALFRDELPAARDRVRAAAQAGDVDHLRAALHRLRASCGFVGAARLDAAVIALQQAPRCEQALSQFLVAVHDTLSCA